MPEIVAKTDSKLRYPQGSKSITLAKSIFKANHPTKSIILMSTVETKSPTSKSKTAKSTSSKKAAPKSAISKSASSVSPVTKITTPKTKTTKADTLKTSRTKTDTAKTSTTKTPATKTKPKIKAKTTAKTKAKPKAKSEAQKATPDSKQKSQAVVEEFFAAASAFDFDRALDLIDDDCVYQNVPFHTARGKRNISKALRSMEKAMTVFKVENIHIAANDKVVFTERVDTLGGKYFSLEIPLMGVFVVENGKITEWRDYFDWSLTIGRTIKSLITYPFR